MIGRDPELACEREAAIVGETERGGVEGPDLGAYIPARPLSAVVVLPGATCVEDADEREAATVGGMGCPARGTDGMGTCIKGGGDWLRNVEVAACSSASAKARTESKRFRSSFSSVRIITCPTSGGRPGTSERSG